MTLLVFGKTGQVATELQHLQGDRAMIFLGRDQADLATPETCARAIGTLRPGAVLNAAAYTAVDRAEDEEPLATTINGAAPGAMARACADLGIPLLHISTDYVFDGTGTQPWTETDPTHPINAYGRSKLAGEAAVRAAGGPHVILRTSWVFSPHGGNFVKTMLRLARDHDTLSVVDDQIGGPTPARAIAKALLSLSDALRDGAPGGTLHFSGQPYVSWAGFARAIFAAHGAATEVVPVGSAAYPTPAARPRNSRLRFSKAQGLPDAAPSWEQDLRLVTG